MNDKSLVFDRAQLRRQRRRAAAGFAAHDFLYRELAWRLLDRLADIRQGFPLAVDLSPRPGMLEAIRRGIDPRLGGIEAMVGGAEGAAGLRLACDEEALPFRAGSLDLVLSCMGLHWVNDLPGALVQIRDALRPDGLFLAVLLGGETLTELRQCLMEAELAEASGASPRVSPMVGLRDAAGLLQRASFALPVADAETLTVTYPDAMALMRDLRGMGEGNALVARARRPLGRRVLARASALYAARFAGSDGRIAATFQAIFMTGWSPAANQQQPARRGSGEVSLTEFFAKKR
ncbi:methyltransferase domain-containing protein [Dongia sp.]|uniref:methyltransferase domain-containing protein n=1 Tax=Dongia sp. TaxID=1977262 RepID=UPI0035B1BA3D